MHDFSDYRLGYKSENNEISATPLSIKGEMPSWLQGVLLRNGPAKYDCNGITVNHWFDGFAKLHKFSFADGKINYSCKFIQSDAYKKAIANKRICANEFATNPSLSLWHRILSPLNPSLTDNTNVNVIPLQNGHLAMTETAYPIAFDLETLNTIGKIVFRDNINPQLTTAHPHYDYADGKLINIAIQFGAKSKYIIFEMGKDSSVREPIVHIPVAKPGYLHSFALTDKYVILAEFPLTVAPLELIFSGKPFIENYHWHKQHPTRLFIINRLERNIIGPLETEACFSFHHVNAFEQGSELIVDLLTYPDSEIVQALYLKNILAGQNKLISAQLSRLRINLQSKKVSRERIGDNYSELPRIDYRRHNGKAYTYMYAISQEQGAAYLNQLSKLDLTNGKTMRWQEDLCFPGEPVFVSTPGSAIEDDGIVLSVVLDVKAKKSFLLILRADNMQELARAEMPNIMPFGFHGQFMGG